MGREGESGAALPPHAAPPPQPPAVLPRRQSLQGQAPARGQAPADVRMLLALGEDLDGVFVLFFVFYLERTAHEQRVLALLGS